MKKIDYETGIFNAWKKNISAVRAEIDTNDMKLKIANRSKRYGFSEQLIREEILSNDLYAAEFAKDPSKQSFHQHYAAEFISTIPNIYNFEELPAGGLVSSLMVDGGKIVCRKDVSSKNDTKSIDFKWNVLSKNGVEYTFYAAHKHTTGSGGGQDNQFNDLKAFMRQASNSNVFIPNTYFLAIADGDYYQKSSNKRSLYKNRIEEMNAEYKTDFCLALTSNEIEEFVSKIVLSGV